MAAIKYKVKLTEAERSRLNEVSQRGKASARTVKRALSLLKADQGLRDREIADVLLVNAATVARARKRYAEEGLEAAINDRPRPGQERKLDGKQEAAPRIQYGAGSQHPPARRALRKAFEPGEARRIAQRLEFHYTPTHGSWLNMAEIELSVFSRGCLNRRISDEAELRREVAALERERNAAKSVIDWRFTTQDARRKLQYIYPTRSD